MMPHFALLCRRDRRQQYRHAQYSDFQHISFPLHG
jgi:hypothetical protein